MDRNANKVEGKFKAAVEDCTALLKNAKDVDEVLALLVNRAFCFGKMSDYKSAISDYTAALAHCKDDVHSLFNRGICYEKIANFQNVT